MATEYRWRYDRFEHIPNAPARELLVADSWRSEGGRAAALEYHFARFEDAVGRVGGPAFDWALVWRALSRQLERAPEPSLFPRIGLDTEGLILTVRPCPPARAATTLAVFEGADPRRAPQIKGPDIARLAREKAGAATDDLILRDTDGALLEATTGALVRWRDDGLVISNRFDRQLPSVTLRQVFDRARGMRIPVHFQPLFAAELGDGPLWFLNAVHGISPVREVELAGETITIPEHPDLVRWRAWWWTTLAPITEALDSAATRRRHPSLRECG